jgi:hypothetical protein
MLQECCMGICITVINETQRWLCLVMEFAIEGLAADAQQAGSFCHAAASLLQSALIVNYFFT